MIVRASFAHASHPDPFFLVMRRHINRRLLKKTFPQKYRLATNLKTVLSRHPTLSDINAGCTGWVAGPETIVSNGNILASGRTNCEIRVPIFTTKQQSLAIRNPPQGTHRSVSVARHARLPTWRREQQAGRGQGVGAWEIGIYVPVFFFCRFFGWRHAHDTPKKCRFEMVGGKRT